MLELLLLEEVLGDVGRQRLVLQPLKLGLAHMHKLLLFL